MLKQFVDVVSAVLLVSLVLGALFPTVRLATGRDPARPGARPVFVATFTGLTIAVIVLILHENSLWRFNRQRLTLTTLEPTIIVGIATLVLAWMFGRRTLHLLQAQQKPDQRTTILNPNPISRRNQLLVVTAASLWAGLIVFRDAQLPIMQARTFVPVGATVFSTATFLNVVGYVLGWLVAILAAFTVFRLCQARPTWTLPLFSVLFTLLTLTHILLVVRLLNAIRVIFIPVSVAEVLAWIINHQVLFDLTAVAACTVAAIFILRAAKKNNYQARIPAVDRLRRMRNQAMTRRAYLGFATYASVTVLLTVGAKYASQEIELSEPEPYDLTDAGASIPLESLNDGHLHRYAYQSTKNVEVRWIVIQKAGASYGVGLDACEICGPSGYYEKDGQVICKLCGVAMNIATIGFKGGCNPIPIDYEVKNGVLAISKEVLEESAEVFA
ncbi:MAG: DUF2318 domain-containing protein [Actinomycetaceae bacterium]|nr:DUF2318 domain-containing protein [Actinomycetaceae bacterium]